MSEEADRLLKEVFIAAVEKPDGPERAAYLAAACGQDAQMRQRIDNLLREHQRAGSFLEEPAAPPAKPATVLSAQVIERAGDRIGRYKLLQEIGEGGCGVVYMAEQEEPVHRRVALKVIKLGMDTKQVIARFEAERQALALMDHPNIAKVLDAGGTESGRPYFVMELVRGVKITDYCDREKLATGGRLDLFIQVCHAIQHAHQKGIIHRDIKPSNILVTVNDGLAVPKVIDFGVAKATGQRLTDRTLFTAFEQFIGTPAYMSPEQTEMTSLDIDTRSDIYALGVLLYELLTGKTPFDARTLAAAGLEEMRRIIREKEPVRPSTRLSAMLAEELTTTAQRRQANPPRLIHLVRGDLDWIVMKCLEKDRALRYDTANGLAMDVQRFQNSEPVVARPPSAAYRVRKFVRRNRGMVTAAATVGAVLVLGIFVSAWQAVRATKAEVEQRRLREVAQKAQADEARERRRAEGQAYAADMNLAQQAWEQNRVRRVRELLEETAAYPGRGFEWYYWHRQTHLALKTLRGHLAGVVAAAFSPDGKRIVSGSFDGTAKVWEAASGKELLALKGHSAAVWSVAFSLDSQRIVTGSFDQTARVWDAASGKELLTIKGDRGVFWSVAFSPDGRRIATGGGPRAARIWDAASGKELLTLEGHSDWVNSVAFSPDGRQILTGSRDETAKVWDADSGRERLTLQGHSGSVESAVFSPDGQRIATGSRDKTAKVWEAASGKELLTLKGHSDAIWSVAFSHEGRRIVTGSLDWTAKVWEAASGNELLTLKCDSGAVRSAAFSPDSQRVVTSGEDGTVKLWEAANGKEPLTLEGHSDAVWSAAFSADGQRIVTGSWDHTAKVWETASGGERLTLKGHSDHIESAVFSPDGRRIVTGSRDRTAKVWDAASGRELLTLRGHSDAIESAVFSPDGQRIATGSRDKTAKVWDAASGKELLTLRGHSAAIWSAAFSPEGRRIVTGSFDQTAKVWEAAGGKELLTLKGHSNWVASVVFSPDGQRIVTGSSDGTAKVWEAASGKELLTLKGHTGQVGSVAFSPDGRRIVTGSWDRTAKVWEAATTRQVAAWQKEER